MSLIGNAHQIVKMWKFYTDTPSGLLALYLSTNVTAARDRSRPRSALGGALR